MTTSQATIMATGRNPSDSRGEYGVSVRKREKERRDVWLFPAIVPMASSIF